jgi:DNA-binding response OmpR family regulator
MKIVVVEDDILLFRHYERILKRADIKAYHATHALEAIDVIDEIHPDVIVADMLLTGSTALPLLHELQSHDDLAKIPVVMITNLAADISLDTLKPYGVKKLLDKMTMKPNDLIDGARSVVI